MELTTEHKDNGNSQEAEIVRLKRIEEAARAAARYHVIGYGGHEEDWDADHMLVLLDKLALALDE